MERIDWAAISRDVNESGRGCGVPPAFTRMRGAREMVCGRRDVEPPVAFVHPPQCHVNCAVFVSQIGAPGDAVLRHAALPAAACANSSSVAHFADANPAQCSAGILSR